MKTRKIELQPLEVEQPDIAYSVESVNTGLLGARLGVSRHNVISDNPEVLQFLAWSGHVGRPDEVERSKAIAEYLDATLTTVDNPGVGPLSTYLRPGDGYQLRRRNLTKETYQQYEALRRSGVDTLGKVSFFGYSMGADMASNLAWAMPQASTVENIVLIEPASATKRSQASLAIAFALDALRDPAYRAENPEWFQQYPQTPPPQKAALAHYVGMMARGSAYDALPTSKAGREAKITVVTGEKSRIISPEQGAALAEHLSAEHWLLKGENHSMLNSLGRMADLMSLLHEDGRL